jgi:transcriptional regulator with XRE-family HTH domain
VPNSKKLINFNISALARDFGVSSSTLKDWINGDNISKTALHRIAKICSELLSINITPHMLLTEDLSVLTLPGKVRDTESLYGIDHKIFELLEKYQELKPLIMALLQQYDRK